MTSGQGEIKLFINACGIRTDRSKQVTDHQDGRLLKASPALSLVYSSFQTLLHSHCSTK